MTFQPLIPTVLTPVVVPVLPDPAAAILAVAEALQPDLAQGFQIDALRLRTEMERAFGGSDATGAWDWKLAYEAGEVALVLFLRKFGRALLARAGSLAALTPILAKVSGLLPTHTRRSEEMERFQQFSTPLPMGLAALAAAKITHADLVLEPSAGTGLLAILAEIAGGALALNELAETRADLLRLLFPGRSVTRFDAAQIDDHLDTGFRPSVILMNPPFSAVANVEGRTTEATARHIRSALARLAPGGRLVVITGAGFAPDAPAWAETFDRLTETAHLVFTGAVSGATFAKHGTSFETRLSVFDKCRGGEQAGVTADLRQPMSPDVSVCAMSLETEDLLRDLSQNAESVCRHYLPAGRREGSYWMVGDLQNNPGRSLFVRLTGPTSGPGARGKWTDSATSEFGDLLDIIRERTGITRFPDLLAEARMHLGRPQSVLPDANSPRSRKSPSGTPAAAARLFAASLPLAGSLAEVYLRSRGITQPVLSSTLRFHPKCWHRDEGQTKPVPRPAMIAAVTDGAGALQGVHRTWLAPDGQDKAAVDTPRRAMGHLLGNAVRIATADQSLVLGEGIETMLSVREAAPSLPVWAALSSGHLGAVLLPAGLQRLYIAIDRDPAGHRAAERLTARAIEAGIAVRVLEPRLGDFNDDLRAHGVEAMRQHLAQQIDLKDQHRLTI